MTISSSNYCIHWNFIKYIPIIIFYRGTSFEKVKYWKIKRRLFKKKIIMINKNVWWTALENGNQWLDLSTCEREGTGCWVLDAGCWVLVSLNNKKALLKLHRKKTAMSKLETIFSAVSMCAWRCVTSALSPAPKSRKVRGKQCPRAVIQTLY